MTALVPTKNTIPVSMSSMEDSDDEEIPVKKPDCSYPDILPERSPLPFLGMPRTEGHHIIDRRHGEAFDVLLSLSHSIVDSLGSCYPYTAPKPPDKQPVSLLHPGFPIPITSSVELCELGAPEVGMPTVVMLMDCQIFDSR